MHDNGGIMTARRDRGHKEVAAVGLLLPLIKHGKKIRSIKKRRKRRKIKTCGFCIPSERKKEKKMVWGKKTRCVRQETSPQLDPSCKARRFLWHVLMQDRLNAEDKTNFKKENRIKNRKTAYIRHKYTESRIELSTLICKSERSGGRCGWVSL